MRATLKIVLPLIVSVASVSLVFAGYQVRNQRRILRNDLARRAEILADSLQESIERELGRGQDRGLRRFVERYGQREHLRGIAIYDTGDHLLAITPGLEPALPLHPTAMDALKRYDHTRRRLLPDPSSAMALLQAGVDKTVIALWLGHVDVRSTQALPPRRPHDQRESPRARDPGRR